MRSTLLGAMTGAVGVLITYVVVATVFGLLLIVGAMFSLTKADLMSAATVSIGLLSVAFVLTWWITFPIGCLTGHLNVSAINTHQSA